MSIKPGTRQSERRTPIGRTTANFRSLLDRSAGCRASGSSSGAALPHGAGRQPMRRRATASPPMRCRSGSRRDELRLRHALVGNAKEVPTGATSRTCHAHWTERRGSRHRLQRGTPATPCGPLQAGAPEQGPSPPATHAQHRQRHPRRVRHPRKVVAMPSRHRQQDRPRAAQGTDVQTCRRARRRLARRCLRSCREHATPTHRTGPTSNPGRARSCADSGYRTGQQL